MQQAKLMGIPVENERWHGAGARDRRCNLVIESDSFFLAVGCLSIKALFAQIFFVGILFEGLNEVYL